MAKTNEILVFEIEGQLFGLSSICVREVLRAVALSPIPNSPPTIEGLLNMRGELVAVLDLRCMLQFPTRLMEPEDNLIVFWVEDLVIAIRVDSARDLVALEIKPSTNPEPEANREVHSVIDYVAKSQDGVVHVINPERLLRECGASEIVQTLSSSLAEEV